MRWLLVVTVMSSACVRRVELAPVAPPQPEDAARFVEAYGVKQVRLESTWVGSRPLLGLSHVDTTVSGVRLGNDVEVEDPRDLLPIVASDERFALLARDYGAVRDAWTWPVVGMGATFGGGVLALALSISTQSIAGMLASAGVALVGPLVSLALGKIFLPDVDRLRASAFAAYVEAVARLAQP